MGFVLSFILPFLLSFVYLKQGLAQINIKNVKAALSERILLFIEIMTFGFVIYFVSVFWQLASYVDRLFIGYFFPNGGAEEIAIYSISISLASLSHWPPQL